MCHDEILPDRAEGKPALIAVYIQPNTTQAAWQAQLSAEIAAHLPLKPFYYRHGDFTDEKGPEDSWEDPVLVDPGLESSGEPRHPQLSNSLPGRL